ncbi:PDZ domain-containing protein [Paenalkalicoccus suaedae]|uniref:endopeptidase La n=1 Tax=Paenalkalicoccus suaedae TaxID=2592382 RepID=A0A859FKF0_9BACI|nr:SepM family pheromone-processing serine protease [Paenalkalicoccus suaedae]QKS73259.1 PDZ domain-containing protein [Paenalkalicoccus suaedae]
MNGKSSYIKWGIVLLVVIAVNFIRLPYYFTVPGEALELSEVIEVEGAEFEENGSLMLTTIRMGQANTVNYLWSLISDRRDIVPEDQVRPPGETDDMYNHRQMMLMSSSQEQAVIVAYQAAGAEAYFEEYGALITSVIPGMGAEGILEAGDRVIGIDGEVISDVDELFAALEGRSIGDVVEVTFERNEDEVTENIEVLAFPEDMGAEEGRGGVGIANPITDRELVRNPDVDIDTNRIGGPSAGLMFSLEIYNQLTEEDITQGLNIAGTGTINEDGDVGPIGGVKQKVYASHEANADAFLVPAEPPANGGNSNYEDAVEVADSIGTDMDIVPIYHFDDAIDYLESIS